MAGPPRAEFGVTGDDGISLSLRRGLSVLELLGADAREWSVREVGEQLGIPPASAHRIVKALCQLGFVESSSHRMYRLGLKVLTIASQKLSQVELRSAARPVIAALVADFGETVNLMVPADDSAVCVESVEGYSPIRPRSARIGEKLSYNWGASPIAILAFLPDEDQERVLRRKLSKATSSTLTDAAAIRARCAEVRTEMVAYSVDEFVPGTLAVAAPIFSGDRGVISGSMCLTGVAALVDRLPLYLERLREDCQEVSRRLGAPAANQRKGSG